MIVLRIPVKVYTPFCKQCWHSGHANSWQWNCVNSWNYACQYFYKSFIQLHVCREIKQDSVANRQIAVACTAQLLKQHVAGDKRGTERRIRSELCVAPDFWNVRTATTLRPSWALRSVTSQSEAPSTRPTRIRRRGLWRLCGMLVGEGRRLEPRLEHKADKQLDTLPV